MYCSFSFSFMLTDTWHSNSVTELFVLKLSFVHVNRGVIPGVPAFPRISLKWDVAAWPLKPQY